MIGEILSVFIIPVMLLRAPVWLRIGLAFLCYNRAVAFNRNGVGWTIAALLAPVPVTVVLFVLGPKKDSARDSEFFSD